jgi:hypothetical protein
MERLDATAARAMRMLLDAQPLDEAKVRFAWTVAAGPALARATTVAWTDGVLSVRAKSEAWRLEVRRGRAVILQRISQLVGEAAVRRIELLQERGQRPAAPGRTGRS